MPDNSDIMLYKQREERKCRLAELTAQRFGFIDGKREEMLAFWKELVNHEGRYDEVENLREVAAFLKKGFEEAGFKCELVETGSEFAPVLTGVLGAERKGAPVLFTGHYDTVFKKGTYGENPFHIENGRAYGPGDEGRNSDIPALRDGAEPRRL